MEKLGEGQKELKGFTIPEEEKQYQPTSPAPTNLPVLNHQPKSTQRGTDGSNCLCSKGMPYLASMGGEALGPVETRCLNVGEC